MRFYTKSLNYVFNYELITDKTARCVFGVTIFTLCTVIGAYIRIPLPFTPVPVTLQTFFVILSGAALGPWLGLSSQMLYILLGTIGLPFFAGGNCGVIYLMTTPTLGYLIGFLVVTIFSGIVFNKSSNDKNIGFSILFFGLSSLLILILGTLWLYVKTKLTLVEAISQGFLPFVLGDSVKTISAGLIYSWQGQRLRKWFK